MSSSPNTITYLIIDDGLLRQLVLDMLPAENLIKLSVVGRMFTPKFFDEDHTLVDAANQFEDRLTKILKVKSVAMSEKKFKVYTELYVWGHYFLTFFAKKGSIIAKERLLTFNKRFMCMLIYSKNGDSFVLLETSARVSRYFKTRIDFAKGAPNSVHNKEKHLTVQLGDTSTRDVASVVRFIKHHAEVEAMVFMKKNNSNSNSKEENRETIRRWNANLSPFYADFANQFKLKSNKIATEDEHKTNLQVELNKCLKMIATTKFLEVLEMQALLSAKTAGIIHEMYGI